MDTSKKDYEQLKSGCKSSLFKNNGKHYIVWNSSPTKFLVIHKLYDDYVIKALHLLISWFCEKDLGDIYLEQDTYNSIHEMFNCTASSGGKFTRLHSFEKTKTQHPLLIDLVICLGGDGTLLYASSLFQKDIPPVMAFSLGTLGFLTPFPFSNFREIIINVLNSRPQVVVRSRIDCCVELTDGTQICQQSLNEVVVDRGVMPFSSNLDIRINDKLVTTVAGDGVIISTPTGSTAYAMSVGASMIHPDVNCILVAPINPHSLSFRPIVLPEENLQITVSIHPHKRCSMIAGKKQSPAEFVGLLSPTYGDLLSQQHEVCCANAMGKVSNSSTGGPIFGASVSVDGRAVSVLTNPSDKVRIQASRYPLISLSYATEKHQQREDEPPQSPACDWFKGLAEILHWNARSTTDQRMDHQKVPL